MNPPNGFADLVEFIFPNPPTFTPEKDDDTIWFNFCSVALINPNITDAERNFVYDELDAHDTFIRSSIKSPNQQTNTNQIIQDSIKNATNPAKDKKVGALKKIEREISELENTLKDADYVFDKHNDNQQTPGLNLVGLNSKVLNKISGDKSLTGEVLQNLTYTSPNNPYKIFNIGHTKAVLWMHACGVGQDFAPDNNHTKRFLIECGFKPSVGYSKTSYAGNPQPTTYYYVINNKVDEIVKKVNLTTNKQYHVLEGSYVIYLYMATKSLLKKRKIKRFYDPLILLEFMDDRNFDLDNIEEYLYDIEKVDELGRLIEEFIDENYSL